MNNPAFRLRRFAIGGVCFLLLALTATAGASMQPPFVSQQCPTGGPEAEQLYQLGVDYHMARKGLPYSAKKAEQFYDEAMRLGNAKAAINLGVLYRQDYVNLPNESGRLIYQAELFQWAADKGCPEGLFALAEAYNWGWGVPMDQRKARSLVEEAAEKGCLGAMVQYGGILYEEGKHEKGKRWIQKSFELGNGDAGRKLAFIYEIEGDSEKIIFSLRNGAKLGSRGCIHDLACIYLNGDCGQNKDEEYAKRLVILLESIDKNEYPKPIPNFDELFPPKPILPFKFNWSDK
jgi:TPR repeat protein